MSWRKKLIVTAAAAGMLATVAANAGPGRVPRSAFPGVAALDRVDRFEAAPVDRERLLAADIALEGSGRPVRPRFAEPDLTSLSPRSHGTWESLDDGSRLWRLRIGAPGALSLNLGIDTFELPPGASFWVHDADGAQVQGPYTAAHRNAAGGLWTAIVLGEELVAELHLPAGTEAGLEISSVNRGYRFFGEPEDEAAAKRGACNVNVVCPEGDPWRDQIRSVGRITISGIWLCSGQLVNTTAGNEIPYLLTAQHCIEQPFEAPSVVAYWNYQTASCSQFTGGSLSENQSGATWVASSPLPSGSDFTLVELDAIPDPDFNVYFAGWDATGAIPASTTTIHHPGGDEKSISFDDDPPTITSYLGTTPLDNGRYWRIGAWDLGTTEGGSSGACLFDDATGRCIGTLSGGYAACSAADQPDWYARLASQFTGEGSPGTRLADWLDPEGTGALFVDGKDGTQVEGADIWLIPAAASLPGVGDSDWRSQVSVVNLGDIARNVTLYLVRDGDSWPGELLAGPYAIRPMESLYLDDPLGAERPVAGLLYASVSGGGTVAFSRTYNLADGGVTFGQGMPAVHLSAAMFEPELVLPMVHSVPGRYRTNVGFAQASAGNFRVLVSIHAPNGGLLAEREYAISTGWRQIDDIFGKLGIGALAVEGGWIRIRVVAGAPASWTAYATVIDNTTDDPTYVPAVAP